MIENILNEENEAVKESIEDAAITDENDATVNDEGENKENAPVEEESLAEEPDYAKIIDDDIRALKEEFPELHSMTDIYELKNPARYGALRDLGLSAKEAYLASGGVRAMRDNRSHLYSSVPKSATSPLGEIPRQEFELAKEIFSDMSDSEIRKLYQKVKR